MSCDSVTCVKSENIYLNSISSIFTFQQVEQVLFPNLLHVVAEGLEPPTTAV